ncbi:c-type cytochrome [Oxalobacteraceae sp. CFBP 8755]|jgi:cytochrome c|nr:c-type cytochrome [Oxalobacteraceae sp. CFBP 8755]
MRALIIGFALLLGTGAEALAAPAPASAPAQAQVDAGRRLFARCSNCHEVGAGARNGFGPQLNGIVGRKAGSAPAYAYSPALKKAGFVWNEQNLVAFIRDSEKVVPGNKMRFLSFMSEKQAAEIVAYLRTQGAVAASPAPKR